MLLVRQVYLAYKKSAQIYSKFSRPKDRPKRTWLEVVQRHWQVRGLSRDDAMVRCRWRKKIRMVDEQQRCEWMNVSSGTGSPG